MLGDPERLQLHADCLEDLCHRRLPRLTCELGADPRVIVDGVEDAERERANRLVR